MSEKKFSVRSRAQSFAFAFSGFMVLVRTQHNFRLHLVAAVTAILMSCWLGISHTDFSIILLAIAGVLVTEAVNTSVEMVVNMFSAQRSWPAKWAKDVAASAVLISALGAFLIGLLILGPPLYQRLLEML